MKNKKHILILILFSVLWFTAGAQTYYISDEGTINTCSGTLYDSGGASGDYSNNESYTMTVCSDVAGAPVELYFVMFDVEPATWDNLTIYNGPNTSAPVLAGPAGSNDFQGQTFTGSDDCITLSWETDASVTSPGFEAEISCVMTCQDYTIDIVSTSPGLSNPDSLWIDVCQEEQVTFTAEGTYPNNNTDYLQTDNNVTWEWTASSGNEIIELSGQGENVFSPTFTESGGYNISLVATDINGCAETFIGEYRVRVSMDPIYGAITVDQDTVCPGDSVNFNGSVSTDTCVMSNAGTQIFHECITDQQGTTQEFCLYVNAFQPGQTITTGDELESVCMNIEHSFMGDLYIYIQCPNGQQAMIHEYYECNGTSLGEPDQADDCAPGIGYNYCWSMNATQSQTAICSSDTTLPSDTYLPLGTFDDLIGCPINGEWCVVIVDDWAVDDGTLFEVDLNFDNSITPANTDMWTIEHTYDPDDIFWSGNGMESNSGGSATAYPDTSGDQTYTFSVIDDFGCQYDTTLNVTVNPLPELNLPDTALMTYTDEYFEYTLESTYDEIIWPYGGTGQTYSHVYTEEMIDTVILTVGNSGCYVTDTLIVDVQICGMFTEEGDMELSLFPNPTSGKLHVNINEYQGDLTIQILSIEGKHILERDFNSKGKFEHSFDMAPYISGIYIVRVLTENDLYYYKVIKQ